MKVTITIECETVTQLRARIKCANMDIGDESHALKDPDKHGFQFDKEISGEGYHISIETE